EEIKNKGYCTICTQVLFQLFDKSLKIHCGLKVLEKNHLILTSAARRVQKCLSLRTHIHERNILEYY
ncbi:MAG: hypothetical protein ACXACI_16210, partial [Candidatus Hodarchaeales archaeon]